MILIESDYDLGDIVFLKTDSEQKERIVTAIQKTPNGIMYRLAQSTTDTWHYALEFTKEKDILKSMAIEKSPDKK